MNLTQLFNKKNLTKYNSLINKIHQLENSLYSELVAEELAIKLREIKNSTSFKPQEKILHAMAIANKASQVSLKMAYYDVQFMGALSLVDGCIAEMKTGEGKTLTCSAAVAANYVLGFKTHVATANEYLAQRDQETLSPLYNLLGISSSFTVSKMSKDEKRVAYNCDVLYSTAQELGFDFLKDNLVHSIEEKVQPLDYSQVKAIIDEADFILIDEARTPLIISGEAPVREMETYQLLKNIANQLMKMPRGPSESLHDVEDTPPGDFWIDDKNKSVYLSESGYENLEKFASQNGLIATSVNQNNGEQHYSSLYQNHNSWIIHEVLNALKAQYCYIKDKDYIVHSNEIVIVDQNTGRLSEGRSWSKGLHQAIEAKENVKINPETMTLGSISIQNYFRNYAKISGMSGTVMNSSEEFNDIYNTTTIQIPTNRKMIRIDHQDKTYLTMNAKYLGVIEDVYTRHKNGQPILIGTTSVRESEIISELLTKKKIPHHVLNAKNNFKEAQIIAQAGQPFSVTVSTSMAGRGTDIILGGNKEALITILNNQLESVIERRQFFKHVEEQVAMLKTQEDDVTLVEHTEAQMEVIDEPKVDDVHIDHNEIQEQIGYLYNPNHINGIINQGFPFIENHLSILERSIRKQIDVVENSSAKWREHVIKVGGLFVLGSSRNESRRIDDQLRGRAGRQGDPGESNFYLSLEDPWLNIFGKNPLFNHLARSLPPNQPISSPMVTKAFAKAQGSIESHHFNARKDTFQYDSIADEGRRQFIKFRNSLLTDITTIEELFKDSLLDSLAPLAHPDFLDFMDERLKLNLDDQGELIKVMLTLPVNEVKKHISEFLDECPYVNLKDSSYKYLEQIETTISQLLETTPKEVIAQLNYASLKQLDKKWTEHLVFIEDARQNVAFSSLAQKNPLHEFKKLCFASFGSMIGEFKNQVVDDFYNIFQSYKLSQIKVDELKEENLALTEETQEV